MSSMIPSNTLMTNELRLHDFKGIKASMTFGDADINDGYSYLRINFGASDKKFDFWQDKPIFNIVAKKELTFNDYKVWHECNDGPSSGLNADMLDGLHASEFKDRMGHHHFAHAWTPKGGKNFVKIATFTPRRVGNAPDFTTTGEMPYQGIFADNILKRKNAEAKFQAFIDDTPQKLGPVGVHPINHTDMYSEGIYNATLRASISILRKGVINEPPWNGPDTVDIHIGIFEDPTNQDEDGWTCTSKYFYVSLHGRSLPFLTENDHPDHDWEIGNNVQMVPVKRIIGTPANYKKSVATKLNDTNNIFSPGYQPPEYVDIETLQCDTLTGNIDILDHDGFVSYLEARCWYSYYVAYRDLFFLQDIIVTHLDLTNQMTHNLLYHVHERPPIDDSNYATPPDPSKNDYVVEEFPPIIPPGFGYQHELDVFRLYFIESHKETVDGVEVITHQFDLYMATDQKTEIRVQPYMSSSCLLYNYQEPIIEEQMPNKKFIRPKSIYDDRYAHVEHRHENYEDKIERIDIEIGEIWDMFDNYVVIDQGILNANKVLFTNDKGHVVCIEDNLERHFDDRRQGNKVLASDSDKCIVETDVDTEELAQLKGVTGNIQIQLNQLEEVSNHCLDRIGESLDLIRRLGDNMIRTVGYLDIFASEIDWLERQVCTIWDEFTKVYQEIGEAYDAMCDICDKFKGVYDELAELYDRICDVYRDIKDIYGAIAEVYYDMIPVINLIGDTNNTLARAGENLQDIWWHIKQMWPILDALWKNLFNNFVKRAGDTMWGDLVMIPKQCAYADPNNPEGSSIHIINGAGSAAKDYEHLRMFVRRQHLNTKNNQGDRAGKAYYSGMCEMVEFEDSGGKRPIWTYDYDWGRNRVGEARGKFFQLWKEAFLTKISKVSIRGDVPTDYHPIKGDIWIKIAEDNKALQEQLDARGLGEASGDGSDNIEGGK